jgi:membrane fusion protein, adhesin transport system
MALNNYQDTNKQLRMLSQSAVLEESSTPYLLRTTMLLICLTVIAFIGWAYITMVKEVAKTVGEVIPTDYVQSLQHLEGGIISQILVRDDDTVSKGQMLIRMSGEKILSDYERIETKQRALLLKAIRLRSLAYAKAVDFKNFTTTHPEMVEKEKKILKGIMDARNNEKLVMKEQITQKKEQLKILKKELETTAGNLEIVKTIFKTQHKLYEERLVSESEYLDAMKEKNKLEGTLGTIKIKIVQARQHINEFKWRLKSSQSSSRETVLQKLGEVESEIAENIKVLEKLKKQTERLLIQSPVDGIVKGLAVHTIGGVIAPGSIIMEIVPMDSELIAEIKIPPNEIGHIKIGHPASVAVTAYDPSRYGILDGSVIGISATTFSDERGMVYYKGMVKLDQNYLGDTAGNNVIMPGMIVNADIITGEKSLLSYLLKPIHLSLTSAFQER